MAKKSFNIFPAFYFSVLLLTFSQLCSSHDTDNDYEYEPEDFISDDDFYVDEYSENRVFFTIEALLGGKTLEHVTFDNGETDSIHAGSGVYFALGAAHLMFDKRLDVGIKGGILFDAVTAENTVGDKSLLSFTRYPIDIFSHAWIGRHIIGGGISYHIDPTFTSERTHHSADYNDALGVYGEYLYHFTGTGTALGLKYLMIKYKNKDSGEIANGNGLGITFNQMF